MLKEMRDKNGLYYIEKNGENILPNKYDYIELQEYGIVARNSIQGTFLDNTYDFYDLKGNLLFTKIERHQPNYVTDNYFYIYKNYVKRVSNTTADYDRWDHDSSTSYSYLHLDGTYFNIPPFLKLYSSNDNICIFESENKGGIYYYDINNKKIVFKLDDAYNKVKNMIKELNAKFNKKLKVLLVKKIYETYKELIKQYPIEEDIHNKLKDELKERLKLNFNGSGLWELNGYHEKTDSYYCKEWYIPEERQNIHYIIHELNEEIDKLRYKNLRTELKANIFGLKEDIGHQLRVSLLKDTKITTFENELKKLKEVDWDYEYGEYIDLNLFSIDDKLNITINKNNIARFNNYYEKVIGKKSFLSINDFLPDMTENYYNKNNSLNNNITM